MMYRQQTSLPRLPVPSVEQTVEQYLRCVKYLVPPEQFTVTRQKAIAFLESATAAQLQAHIRQNATDPAVPNWLRYWWNDEILRDRNPLGIFLSPVFAFSMSPFPRHNEQSTRAAAVTYAATRFFTELQTESLPVDYHRGKPLCMDDYRFFLGAVRIPAPGRDVIVSHLMHNAYSAPHHIIVMCGGRIFRMAVISPDGQPIPTSALRVAFQGIRDIVDTSASADPDVMPPSHAFGALTFLQRDQWAVARGHLIQSSPTNRLTLHTIESALFVVSLDDTAPQPHTGEALHHLMHGLPLPSMTQTPDTTPGPEYIRARLTIVPPTEAPLPINRWWDKSLQIHVARNGHAGLTFEHSVVDSLPPLRLCRYIQACDTKPNSPLAESSHHSAAFSELRFITDALLSDAVGRGSRVLAETLQRLDLSALRIAQYGSNHLKSLHISPDGFVQMGLQVAFQKVRGFVPSTHESVTTRAFLHGRTEALRVVSEDSQEFVTAFERLKQQDLQGYRTVAHVAELLRRACTQHMESIVQARTGNGCNRHLYGLMLAAQEKGIPLPEIFTDAAFRAFSTITLSTTHPIPTLGADGVGFGPISERCIGVGYFVFDQEIIFGVSSWREDGRVPFEPAFNDSARFTTVLEEALHDMHRMLALTKIQQGYASDL
uniref:Choline/Carnitine o-acyltransferase n=1 Tax=Candidatus Kentrum sp. TUN TaxID=2126343 RepID=A0A451A4D1_9GAMM|nr:MAG: Choline/Carnitine o-acyltransferase [Candidatus Kentron sp. TUN]